MLEPYFCFKLEIDLMQLAGKFCGYRMGDGKEGRREEQTGLQSRVEVASRQKKSGLVYSAGRIPQMIAGGSPHRISQERHPTAIQH